MADNCLQADVKSARKRHPKPVFRYGQCGALTSSAKIPCVTQTLDGSSEKFYGGRYFIAESMTRQAAATLAIALGGTLEAENASW